MVMANKQEERQAGLDAACKATQISRAGEPASPEPSHPGRARGPQEEQKPVGGGQPSGSGPNRDQWDQAARERLGLGLREALTAVLGVMAAEGKGEGWGGWAGAQDRGGVHGAETTAEAGTAWLGGQC